MQDPVSNLGTEDLEELFNQMNQKDMIELESLEAVYIKHCDAHPDDLTTRLKLAHVFCLRNKMIDACQQCEDILKLEPTHMVTRLLLMDIYHQVGEFDKALANGKQILEFHPHSDIACNNLGNIYSDLEQYDQAKTYYKKALELNPAAICVYNNLCLLLKELKEYDDAISIGLIALALDPELLPVYNNIGICYQKKNEHDKALEYFEKGLVFDQRNTSLLYNSANSKLAQGNKHEARQLLDIFFDVYQINPSVNVQQHIKTFEQNALVIQAIEKYQKSA